MTDWREMMAMGVAPGLGGIGVAPNVARQGVPMQPERPQGPTWRDHMIGALAGALAANQGRDPVQAVGGIKQQRAQAAQKQEIDAYLKSRMAQASSQDERDRLMELRLFGLDPRRGMTNRGSKILTRNLPGGYAEEFIERPDGSIKRWSERHSRYRPEAGRVVEIGTPDGRRQKVVVNREGHPMFAIGAPYIPNDPFAILGGFQSYTNPYNQGRKPEPHPEQEPQSWGVTDFLSKMAFPFFEGGAAGAPGAGGPVGATPESLHTPEANDDSAGPAGEVSSGWITSLTDDQQPDIPTSNMREDLDAYGGVAAREQNLRRKYAPEMR